VHLPLAIMCNVLLRVDSAACAQSPLVYAHATPDVLGDVAGSLDLSRQRATGPGSGPARTVRQPFFVPSNRTDGVRSRANALMEPALSARWANELVGPMGFGAHYTLFV